MAEKIFLPTVHFANSHDQDKLGVNLNSWVVTFMHQSIASLASSFWEDSDSQV